MERNSNYGLIIRLLRTRAGWSVRKAARQCGRSVGWLSEIENNTGTARLTDKEFDRVVDALGGSRDRDQFRTWVANHKNAERIDRTFDGAVLKHLRHKRQLGIKEAAHKIGLSSGYLCKLENGSKPINYAMRVRILAAYKYSPSSFKNFSKDPKRSQAVPTKFKVDVLLKQAGHSQMSQVFEFMQKLTKKAEGARHE